jgi:hypothetical protein
VAGLAVAAVAASGIALVGAAAEAHTPTLAPSCSGLTVTLKSYAGSSSNDNNSLVVTIDGKQVENTKFGNSFPTKTYNFPAAGAQHTWRVQVTASDSSKWNLDKSGTEAACPTPSAALAATACNAVGGKTDLTATFTNLVNGRAYNVWLDHDGTRVDTKTLTGSSSAPKPIINWPGQTAGGKYVVTLVDANDSSQQWKAEATSVGCPGGERDASATVQQCLAPGQGTVPATVTVQGLVPGRTYIAQASVNGNAINGAVATFATGSSKVTVPVPVATKGITIVVSTEGVAVATVSLDTIACPIIPGAPKLTLGACTVDAPTRGLTVASDGLLDGRVYQVVVDGAVVDTFTASGAYTKTFPTAAGQHTVTIVDLAAGNAATSPSASILQEACATTPKLAITAAQCLAPHEQGSLSGTVTGVVANRGYTVTLTSGGKAVDGVAAQHITPTSNTFPVSFTGLKPGATYKVTVVDDKEASAKASATETLADCPDVPKVALETAQCLAPGEKGGLTPTITGAIVGHTYVITLTSGGKAVTGADPVRVTATTATVAVPTFENLKPGTSYAVTLTDAADDATVVTSESTLADCPKNPGLSAVAVDCKADPKTSSLEVDVTGVEPDRDWTVRVSQGDDDAWTVIDEKTVTSAELADPVVFKDIKNDATYRVTAVDSTGKLQESTDITVKNCGVSDETTTPPTTPPSTPAKPQAGGGTGLAATGVDGLIPGIGALLVLQLGIALLAVAAIRRRKAARQQG